MLCCGKKETVVVDKDNVDPKQFFIGRRQNEKWKQWMSTEDLNAGDEITVEFSDHEQYWRLELNESDSTWSFHVIRSGKKLYVSYDDTDKVTLEEDGNKERFFRVLLQINGQFLIKTPKKDSDENRVLSIGSEGKLALLRGDVKVEPNEWFILKYFKDADKEKIQGVYIRDSSSQYYWNSKGIRKNEQIALASGPPDRTWTMEALTSFEVNIQKKVLWVCQKDKSEFIITEELFGASKRKNFPWEQIGDYVRIQSPRNQDLYLSADDDNKYVILKPKKVASLWEVNTGSFSYWCEGHVQYHPPIKEDECVPQSAESK